MGDHEEGAGDDGRHCNPAPELQVIYDGKAHAVGNEDAGNTHELIDATQAAAHGGRRGFSYVTGHD